MMNAGKWGVEWAPARAVLSVPVDPLNRDRRPKSLNLEGIPVKALAAVLKDMIQT